MLNREPSPPPSFVPEPPKVKCLFFPNTKHHFVDIVKKKKKRKMKMTQKSIALMSSGLCVHVEVKLLTCCPRLVLVGSLLGHSHFIFFPCHYFLESLTFAMMPTCISVSYLHLC